MVFGFKDFYLNGYKIFEIETLNIRFASIQANKQKIKNKTKKIIYDSVDEITSHLL